MLMFKSDNLSKFSNVFDEIGKRWMLITAEKDGKINTMTASWGGLGILWGLPVAYVFVRPQRYTQEFLTAADKFTASFYSEKYRAELNLCGTKSGRDIDKIAEAKLTAVRDERGFVYFEQAEDVLCLKKLYMQQLDKDCAIIKDIFEKNYPSDDFHYMYIAEIEDYLCTTFNKR
jgi:flavin reductase (DIM6/NTAB) family NADH-FMN oxidoreductase RutF